MKHVWIRYRSRVEDIVNQKMLDSLFDQDAIEQFYRTSESRWITLGIDKVRVAGGQYQGPERRGIESQQRV